MLRRFPAKACPREGGSRHRVCDKQCNETKRDEKNRESVGNSIKVVRPLSLMYPGIPGRLTKRRTRTNCSQTQALQLFVLNDAGPIQNQGMFSSTPQSNGSC